MRREYFAPEWVEPERFDPEMGASTLPIVPGSMQCSDHRRNLPECTSSAELYIWSALHTTDLQCGPCVLQRELLTRFSRVSADSRVGETRIGTAVWRCIMGGILLEVAGIVAMIKTKSVHSAIEPGDGIRILATRLRGRGLPKARYDVWMANLGPSEQLLSAMRSKKTTWQEFSRAYRSELADSTAFDKKNRTIKNHGQKFTLRLLQQLGRRGNVTLMCHCAEAETHCHRHILARILARAVG